VGERLCEDFRVAEGHVQARGGRGGRRRKAVLGREEPPPDKALQHYFFFLIFVLEKEKIKEGILGLQLGILSFDSPFI
jgi:hypothetical protein